jgi:glycosylphosphatidylinositol transamidase
MPNLRGFSTLRARSYLVRLPLFTRVIALIICLTWLIGVQSMWDVRQWGTLYPAEVTFTTAHRLSTYPLVHLNFFHALVNVIALTPLIERFEHDHGTLTSFALFFGREDNLTTILRIRVRFQFVNISLQP